MTRAIRAIGAAVETATAVALLVGIWLYVRKPWRRAARRRR